MLKFYHKQRPNSTFFHIIQVGCPVAMGACEAIGGNVMTDAFGVVALIAMAPLITIQILGLYERRKHSYKVKKLHSEISLVKDDIVFFDRRAK